MCVFAEKDSLWFKREEAFTSGEMVDEIKDYFAAMYVDGDYDGFFFWVSPKTIKSSKTDEEITYIRRIK